MFGVVQGSLLASLFIGLLVPSFCIASDDLQDAADSARWRALLHLSSKGRAAIANPGFLLSFPNINAADEMRLTIELLRADPQAACRFPARHYYLTQALQIGLPEVKCPGLDEFMRKAPLEELSLIYASENLTQPSSMMGHTMLAISGSNDQGRHVEHSVSFFTELDSINLPVIMWDTLVVGKKGYFSVQPLSLAMNNYLVTEQRNVWRYPVQLNDEQKTLIQRHLWELKQTDIAYFFDRHNCATLSQDILAVAYPELASQGEMITPLDVVRSSRQAGITADAGVYASNRWKVRLLREFTGIDDRDTLYSPAETESAAGQLRLLQAHAFNNYQLEHGDISRAEWQERNADLPASDARIDLAGYRSPLKVPADSQWSAAYQHRQGDDWLTLSWMPASHTLEDDNRNYFSENELVLSEFAASVNLDNAALRLDRWRIYSVRSLIPYDKLTGGLSGYLQFGFGRYYDEMLSVRPGFLASAGLGRTYGLSRDFYIYGLLGAGAVLGTDQQYLQLEPELGAYLYEVWDMKTWLSYKAFINKLYAPQRQLSVTHSLLAGDDYGVMLGWNRRWTHEAREVSWELKARFYY